MRSKPLLAALGLLCLTAGILHLSLRNRSARLPAAGSPEACSRLYETVCSIRGDSRDPTGVMRQDGEKRVLELLSSLKSVNPKLSPVELEEELALQIYTPRRNEELHAAFRWVEKTMKRFIERQPDRVFSAREKRWLKMRLSKIELELPPPASLYADEPGLIGRDDVHYERDIGAKIKLRVGGGYVLGARSRFNLIFTMAHEFAHAIDPCEARSANIAFPAYSKLIGCFLQSGWVNPRPSRRECGADDQLSEAFADWMAVQITSEALESFSRDYPGTELMSAVANSVRDLCEPPHEIADDNAGWKWLPDTQHHPEPRLRIETIFGQHPKIREVLGCGASPELPRYCRF